MPRSTSLTYRSDRPERSASCSLGEPMHLAEVPYVRPEKTLILVHPLFSRFAGRRKTTQRNITFSSRVLGKNLHYLIAEC